MGRLNEVKNMHRVYRMLVMAFFLVLSQTSLAAELSPLERMLAQVPAAAFEDGFLSYADLQGLSSLVPGSGAPEAGQAADDYWMSGSGSAYRRMMMGVSAGQTELVQTFFQYDKVQEATGLSVFDVAQTVEVGRAPQRMVLMSGDMDTTAVQQALTKKGYQPSDAQQGLWCPEGDCGLGMQVDLAARDSGFLFGGLLGARWPVYFDEGVLAASLSKGAILAAAEEQPSLLEQAAVNATVAALSEDLRQVNQLLLLDPGNVLDDSRAGSSWSGIGLLAIAQADSLDAQRVVITMYYDDTARAEAARAALDAGAPDAVLANGQALPILIDDLGGAWESATVTSAETGAILRIPLRFSEQREALADNTQVQPGRAFSLFVRMVIQMDLQWLTELGS